MIAMIGLHEPAADFGLRQEWILKAMWEGNHPEV